MRKALLIGIDHYENGNSLRGCVRDAISMQRALEFNHDLDRNFETRILAAVEDENRTKSIDRMKLASAIDWLFEGEPDIALLYFSGHGSFNGTEGYLCPSDFSGEYTGVPMTNLIKAAANSKARNKLIILDCCHSGAAGNAYFSNQLSTLPENTVIMAGCSQDGYSVESDGSGVFTQLFVEALNGAGSNLMGEVSVGSIYAHIDKSLGAFDQRPVFKANVNSFISMKKNKPLISMRDLRLLPMLFPVPEYKFPLDPTYEEDKNYTDNKEKNEDHEKIFKILRSYWQVGLIVPDKEEYMYWAAINSDSCKLTATGRHYWKMLKDRVI